MGLGKYVDENWKNTPYLFGGKDKKGVDCSGFIYRIFLDFYQKDLGRKSARDYHKEAIEVSRESLREGDVVFFSHKNPAINHIGVMIDRENFAHASSSKGVIVTPLSNSYWKTRIVSYGRLI